MSQKVVFAGTPPFALPSLEALASHAGVELVAVYTQPDRPAGRGRKLTPSPVKERAMEMGIPVFQPDTLRSEEARDHLTQLTPDLLVVVAYGLILPPTILSVPLHGCVNVHGSLLPRWRGAAPIQRAIEAGDPTTGVSLMKIEAGLDSGPVYARMETRIESLDTAGTLQDRLSELGGKLLLENIEGLFSGSLSAEEQDPDSVIYAPKLTRDEAMIQWTRSASEIVRQIRAFNPWPVATTTFRNSPLRLLMGCEEPDPGTAGTPGEVLAADRDGVTVACGTGRVRLLQLQKAGSRAMTVGDFYNGTGISAGERFG